jgi:hypothetical protein
MTVLVRHLGFSYRNDNNRGTPDRKNYAVSVRNSFQPLPCAQRCCTDMTIRTDASSLYRHLFL